MKLQKGTFFISYIVYIIISIIYTCIIGESDIINTLIFSITIASTFFSIADCIFTKLEIDKREADETFSLYFLTNYAQKFYFNKLTMKYEEEAEKNLADLKNILGDGIDNIDWGNLSEKEQESYLKRIMDPKLQKFFIDLIYTSNTFVEDVDENNQQINEIVETTKQKQKIIFYIPSFFFGIGIITMLVILTVRMVPYSKISNIFTLIAFGAVILNLLFKECYKHTTLQQLADDRRKIMEDLKSEIILFDPPEGSDPNILVTGEAAFSFFIFQKERLQPKWLEPSFLGICI